MTMRSWKYAAALTLVVGMLVAAPAGAAARDRDRRKTWTGMVERHGRHYDYAGSPCAEGEVCAQYVARYRIVPTTRQAARALRRADGQSARLTGRLTPSRESDHQGRLMVSRVQVSSRKSGVEGKVTAGPTCPVERPDEPCPPRPVETDLQLRRADGTQAATGRSDSDGRFRIDAPAGRYTLTADYPPGPGGCSPVEVRVERGQYTPADIDCDTGIR
jgi:hypothetical protein